MGRLSATSSLALGRARGDPVDHLSRLVSSTGCATPRLSLLTGTLAATAIVLAVRP